MDSDGEVTAAAGAVVPARVVEQLPNALFRLALADRSEVLAHVADRRELDFLRLLPGDRVEVRLSPRDARRGRIVKRNAR